MYLFPWNWIMIHTSFLLTQFSQDDNAFCTNEDDALMYFLIKFAFKIKKYFRCMLSCHTMISFIFLSLQFSHRTQLVVWNIDLRYKICHICLAILWYFENFFTSSHLLRVFLSSYVLHKNMVVVVPLTENLLDPEKKIITCLLNWELWIWCFLVKFCKW